MRFNEELNVSRIIFGPMRVEDRFNVFKIERTLKFTILHMSNFLVALLTITPTDYSCLESEIFGLKVMNSEEFQFLDVGTSSAR